MVKSAINNKTRTQQNYFIALIYVYIDIMTLYINKYVALIKAFRKYIHNNNKILFALFCKVYKHILNTKRKEIKKMFNRKHKWILRGRGY